MPPGPPPAGPCDHLVSTVPVRLASLAPPVSLAAVTELERTLRQRHASAELHLEVGSDGCVVVMANLQPPAARLPATGGPTTAIVTAVADAFGVTAEELLGRSRRRELVGPRQAAMALCRELTDLSYPAIARAFGDRDHTTVLHAVRAARRPSVSPAHRQAVDAARAHYLHWKGATTAPSFAASAPIGGLSILERDVTRVGPALDICRNGGTA
jgi:hypothetical protein